MTTITHGQTVKRQRLIWRLLDKLDSLSFIARLKWLRALRTLLIHTATGWQHAGMNQPRHIARPLFCDNEACGLPATTTGTDGQPLCAECAADAGIGVIPPVRTLKATIHIGDTPDEPLSTWLPPSIRLEANTSPRQAADRLREMYTSEWIADLLVCLCSRTAHTESDDA